jgi:hypothetical protein
MNLMNLRRIAGVSVVGASGSPANAVFAFDGVRVRSRNPERNRVPNKPDFGLLGGGVEGSLLLGLK